VTDIQYTPTFHHTDWIDNVDRIVADGPTGFNGRLKAIESDLQQLSTVVAEIDTALDRAAAGNQTRPSGQQRLTVPLNIVFPPVPSRQGFAFLDPNGEFHFPTGQNGIVALIGLSLPEPVRLTSLRVTGRFPVGTQSALTISLKRAPVKDITQAGDTIAIADVAQLATAPTNLYDATVAASNSFANVDLNSFRYFISAQGGPSGDPNTMSLAGIQVGYVFV
jgi:hypothetical protein